MTLYRGNNNNLINSDTIAFPNTANCLISCDDRSRYRDTMGLRIFYKFQPVYSTTPQNTERLKYGNEV